jgi:metal-responsive CopG/Arc/MetJ family transcriptional regulator
MATRKITVSIPADVADRFLKQVPARRRSQYVTAAIAQSLAMREKRLTRACDMANQVSDSPTIEGEWEQMQDRIEEPWDDASAR